MSDVGCCRSRKLALSLTSKREVRVCSPARKSADTFATSGCFLRGHDARVSMLLQANGSIWRDNASWFWLVAAARPTPFRGPWQKPPFVRAYAVGQGAVTPPRSQATLCNHAPGLPTPARKTLLPRALRLRCQAHIAPRIAILDLGYAVQRRPVSLIVGLRNIGVLFWRVVGRLIFRRKRHPRWLLRMSRGGRQCDCHDCGPEDSHRASSSHRRRDKPPRPYKRIHQKAIARAVGPRDAVLVICVWIRRSRRGRRSRPRRSS